MAISFSAFSSGKLLISGEYVVLDGAKALAIPTRRGQHMEVNRLASSQHQIHWSAYNSDQSLWFQTSIDYQNPKPKENSKEIQLLCEIFQHPLVQQKLKDVQSDFEIQTRLDFPKEWGLGTSSTLINNLAIWLEIDAYTLQEDIFGGSGYDIACAQQDEALTFQKQTEGNEIKTVSLNPAIQSGLHFIYLNQKQSSREAIQHYRQSAPKKNEIDEISSLTDALLNANHIQDFESHIHKHNQILSKILKQPSAQEVFSDSPCTVKYLGAWGGDFIMAVTDDFPVSYFQKLGYSTIFSYNELFF